MLHYLFFSRTLAREMSEVCRPDTSPYISPSALGPVASSQNTALHRLFPGGFPFHTQQKKRTHTETTANQRREATHSRGQIQFRLQDALDPRNTRQLFSPGGVGTAQCPPEEHTSTDKPNSRSKEQESPAQDK